MKAIKNKAMSDKYNRREVLKNLALGTGVIGLGGMMSSFIAIDCAGEPQHVLIRKGNINHSVCRWPYNDIPLDTFARECAAMGITAIDLLLPEEWDIVAKYDLKCSMATDKFVVIEHGFNEVANHASLQENYRGLIDKASKHGVKNVIVFSGNRRGMDDKTGIENCARGLRPLLKYAQERGVVLVMELLNSKVNHPDYHCDHTAWGASLADRLEMDNFKLLYDIYHMQIMEGDIIATIRKYHKYINHYHTGGVPGRNEINETQELNYPAIMQAIVDTGFQGYVAQEFLPTYDDKFAALKEGITICDV